MDAPKLDRSAKMIMFLRLFIGYYYSFTSDRITSVIAKAYCVLLSLTIIYVFTTHATDLSVFHLISFICISCDYTFNVVQSLITGDSYFLHYYHQINSLDITPAHTKNCLKISQFIAVFIYIWKIVHYCLILFKSSTFFINPFPFLILTISFHLKNVMVLMIFELLWLRVKALKKSLEINIKNGDFQMRYANIKKCLKTYQSMLEILKTTNKYIKPGIFTSYYILCLIGILANVYSCIMVPNQNIVSHFGSILISTTILFIPLIIAELVAREMDGIKLIIINQLLHCKDENQAAKIEGCLKFLDYRPFKYTVLRAFSMGVPLLIDLVNICTVYTIALIQFTHAFDN